MTRFVHRGSAPPIGSLLIASFLAFPGAVATQSLTLADAAEAALRSHPAVHATGARADAADQAASAARGARLPSFAVTGSMTRFDEPMVVAPLHAFDPTRPPTFDRTLVQLQAGAKYTVFDAGARSSRIEQADALAEAARFGSEATEMGLLEQVATAYLGTLTSRAVLHAATAQVSAVQEEAARAERHFDAGTAAEVELLRARAALLDARARHVSARAGVGLAERSLARVMGVPTNEVEGRGLADVIATDRESNSASVESPVVSMAARVVNAATARLAERQSTRLPKLEVGAGLRDFGSLDSNHAVEWQAGVQISWPLFTGGARSAGILRAEAEVRAARGDLALAELQAESEIDGAATAVQEAEARAQALEAAVTQWTEVARIEALSVEAGVGVQSDLLRAQASLFQARAGHAQARYDAISALVSLARAEGTLDMNWMNAVLEIRP